MIEINTPLNSLVDMHIRELVITAIEEDIKSKEEFNKIMREVSGRRQSRKDINWLKLALKEIESLPYCLKDFEDLFNQPKERINNDN